MAEWFEDDDGIYRVVMSAVHEASGDTQVNVFHYRFHHEGIGPDSNDPQSLADAIADDLFLPFAALYTDDWVIQKPVVVMERDPLAPDAPRSEWTAGAVSFGDGGGSEDLPRALCAIATLRTDAIGRRSTGRKFLGGSRNEGEQANGLWQASALTMFQAYMDAVPRQPDISAPLSEDTATWCVYSRTARASNADNYAFDITDVQVRPQVHWLRSRRQN